LSNWFFLPWRVAGEVSLAKGDRMELIKLYLVEIGRPEEFEKLRTIAKKHRGAYHSRIMRVVGSSFCFTREVDARAFMEEAKDWPQWKDENL